MTATTDDNVTGTAIDLLARAHSLGLLAHSDLDSTVEDFLAAVDHGALTAVRCGDCGHECDFELVDSRPTYRCPYDCDAHQQRTIDEARQQGLTGWNLRCNRCGDYGASWVPGQRPGWGSLALCPPHKEALEAELARHQAALTRLRAINYEQEPARR